MAAIVAHLEAERLWTVEATAEAEDAWADEIVAHAVNGTGGIGGTDCTPGYYNNEGRPLDGPPWGASYGKGSVEFFRLTEGVAGVRRLARRHVHRPLTAWVPAHIRPCPATRVYAAVTSGDRDHTCGVPQRTSRTG